MYASAFRKKEGEKKKEGKRINPLKKDSSSSYQTNFKQKNFVAVNDVIQCQLKLYKPKDESEIKKGSHQEKIHNTARKISGWVDTAHEEFKKGDLKGASDAQQSVFEERYKNWEENKKNLSLVSAAAGYIIEGKVNKKIKESNNSEIQTQVHDKMKGTIPDIVICGDGFVDITAENSVGHILNKKGNWMNNGAYVAETWYPSINFKQAWTEKDKDGSHYKYTPSAKALKLMENRIENKKKEIAYKEKQNIKDFNQLQKKACRRIKEFNENNQKLSLTKKGSESVINNLMNLGVKAEFQQNRIHIQKIFSFKEKYMDKNKKSYSRFSLERSMSYLDSYLQSDSFELYSKKRKRNIFENDSSFDELEEKEFNRKSKKVKKNK